MSSMAGKLLLASQKLADPNFHHTVILLVQHGDDGALGLVLNRPLELSVKDACEDSLEISCRADGLLLHGGPCQGPLMALHTHENSLHFGQHERHQVLSGLYFSTDRDELEWLLQLDRPRALFFLGYSGWGPGQLESELSEGAWMVATASPENVFDTKGPTQWAKLMTHAGLAGKIRPEQIPDDPSLN
jgi:putative transcriptional regulator